MATLLVSDSIIISYLKHYNFIILHYYWFNIIASILCYILLIINIIMIVNWFLDLAKAILSLLIACMKGKIKVNMGLSVLSDLVSIIIYYIYTCNIKLYTHTHIYLGRRPVLL